MHVKPKIDSNSLEHYFTMVNQKPRCNKALRYVLLNVYAL
nr:MAG TPA: hypothetical protein [Caudoviricetes sp.]